MSDSDNNRKLVEGGGGLKLYAEEYGNKSGRPILFIHGTSCSHDFWEKQTCNTALAEKYHMVAMDLRGNGYSEVSHDPQVYQDPGLWADDVKAVIDAFDMKDPVIVGWSYGGLVMADYLRKYGEDGVSGTVWLSTISNVGNEIGEAMFGPLYPSIYERFTSTDLAAILEATEIFVRDMVAKPVDEALVRKVIPAVMMTRPQTRIAMFNDVENDPLLKSLKKPALVIHGTKDPILLPSASEHIAAQIEGCKLSIYEGVGHVTFWEDVERFNGELGEFVDSV